jgi:hypothetical protein
LQIKENELGKAHCKFWEKINAYNVLVGKPKANNLENIAYMGA